MRTERAGIERPGFRRQPEPAGPPMEQMADLAAVPTHTAAPRRPHLHPAADHRIPGRARACRPADLHLLGQVNTLWLVTGLVLEGASLFCYGLLTRAVLPPGSVNPLSRLFLIDLAAAAIAHVIPAGTLGSAGIGYRLFTAEGIKGQRRRGDDGHQRPGLDRDAERPAVAVPGRVHPARGLPPDLRDRGHHRRGLAARHRRPGPGHFPRDRARVPHPARGQETGFPA